MSKNMYNSYQVNDKEGREGFEVMVVPKTYEGIDIEALYLTNKRYTNVKFVGAVVTSDNLKALMEKTMEGSGVILHMQKPAADGKLNCTFLSGTLAMVMGKEAGIAKLLAIKERFSKAIKTHSTLVVYDDIQLFLEEYVDVSIANYVEEIFDMSDMVTIKDIRNKLNMSQAEFAQKYDIPLRTIQNWEQGASKPPEYVIEMIKELYELRRKQEMKSPLQVYKELYARTGSSKNVDIESALEGLKSKEFIESYTKEDGKVVINLNKEKFSGFHIQKDDAKDE